MGVSLVGGGQIVEEFEAVATGDTAPDYIVGTGVEYAAYVEFGTSKMQAQPYLEPAVRTVMRNLGRYEEEADDIEELIKILALEIEREAKQGCPVDTGTLRSSIKAVKL